MIFQKELLLKGRIKSKSQIDKAFKAQQKVLTSIRLDKDLVSVSKNLAAKEGMGYLTWLNKKIKRSYFI